MTGTELRKARRTARWTQARLASRLAVTQAYVSLLETGGRRLPEPLARRLVRVMSLPPTAIPWPDLAQVGSSTTAGWVEKQLTRLGYPGYAHRDRLGTVHNPMAVLLRALSLDDLDPRLAEALPWLLLRFGVDDPTLLAERARFLGLQNRLGFIAALAKEIAEKSAAHAPRAAEFGRLLESLEPCRLAREDTLGQTRMSDRMRGWVRSRRSDAAAHWNIVTDLVAEHLSYG